MEESVIQLPEEITISVERMIRFCYLAEITFEYAPYKSSVLPLHVTRFGTMALESASFLYSLFDDRADSTNLLKLWKGFDHPFGENLLEFNKKLEPFKSELKLTRHRLGFHGSRNRVAERAGLDIFDVDSGRARELVDIIRDMEHLALRMVKWFLDLPKTNTVEPTIEVWQEFVRELKGYRLSHGNDLKNV